MSRARITYRYDRDGNRIEERIPSIEKSLSPKPQEFHQDDNDPYKDRSAFNSNVVPLFPEEAQWSLDSVRPSSDDETLRLENIIREAGRDSDLPEGFIRDSQVELQLIDQNQDSNIEHAAYDNYPYYDPKVRLAKRTSDANRQISWFKVVSSVSAAVITGLLFGYLVLSFFEDKVETSDVIDQDGMISPVIPGNDFKEDDDELIVGIPQDDEDPIDPTPDQLGTDGEGEVLNGVTLQFPKQNLFLLQFGVFNSSNGAKEALNQLYSTNLVGVSYESEGKHYVFAGATAERDSAVELIKQFRERELPLYLKPIELPSEMRTSWEGNASDIQQYVTISRKLVKMVVAVSSLRLQDQTPVALDASTVQALKAEHQLWSTAVTKAEETASEKQKSAMLSSNKNINAAVQAILEYDKNISRAKLWLAQEVAMKYVVSENKYLLNP